MSKEDTIKCFLDCKGEDDGFQLTLTNKVIDVIANEIERLQDQLQQKENIIKEVREYLESNDIMKVSKEKETKGSIFCCDKELLEILDKGVDKE